METVHVVGSGASAVHFALSLLERGFAVHMLDVGEDGEPLVAPEASFARLKWELADPARYFLGEDLRGVVMPDRPEPFHGIPPSKDHVLAKRLPFDLAARGFDARVSLALGGLASAWTAGCYPYNDRELASFPFGYAELGPYYDQVALRIGVSGSSDDLAEHIPLHRHLLEPLRLDDASQALLARYTRHRDSLRRRWGCTVGRARVATLTRDQDERHACRYLGRCIWGCPVAALYTPELTLAACKRFASFAYTRDCYVTHLEVDARRRVRAVVARPAAGGEPRSFPAQHVALGAGTLGSTRIVLESLFRISGERPVLPGLMDNRQLLMPIVIPSQIGRRFDPDTYQLNQIALGLDMPDSADRVHGLLTTLKATMIHPIVQALPLDLCTSLRLFRELHAALGLVNLNFSDQRRDQSYVRLEPRGENAPCALEVRYAVAGGDEARVRGSLARVRGALLRLGAIALPGMTRIRAMGSSLHYAGTIPMSVEPRPLTVSRDCASHDFENLHLVDGATFPFLPAKNPTFTLMANAARIADRAFR